MAWAAPPIRIQPHQVIIAVSREPTMNTMRSVNTLLFLCSGNYYRSRFAEFYFRHLAAKQGLDWHVESRGLSLTSKNKGDLAQATLRECQQLGISVEPRRPPLVLQLHDLENASLTIAVKESEHRPMMRQRFPAWEDRVEYWEIHDVDVAQPCDTFPVLRMHIEQLAERLQREGGRFRRVG